MPNLRTPRIFGLSLALLFTIALLLFAYQRSGVYAAKRATAADDARLSIQLATDPSPRPGSTPVLVELFTSEGCSSCPPADALLARLQHDQPVSNADILALEEHVDYWDWLGWHDRFSSHAITARQSAYAQRLHLDDNYTPQMIVDGTVQFVGNDSAQALRAIAQAARTPKLSLTLSPPSSDGTRIAAEVSVASAPNSPRDADLYAALVEPAASTPVLRGENGGRTLHHVSVVRDLQRVGTLSGATVTRLKFSLSAPPDASSLRIVVFAQRTNQGAILGAVSSASIDATTRSSADLALAAAPR